jgi:microcystin-dependent protein
MTRRYYSNIAGPTSLVSGIDADDTTLTVPSTTGYPTAPFTISLDRGNAGQELILVQGKTSTTFTNCVRGYGGTTASSHLAGVSVEHVTSAEDYDEANAHINDTGLDHHTQYLTSARHAAIDHGVLVAAAGAAPVGSGMLWFGTTAPSSKWLLAYGQAISRATYADLFSLWGTTFGAGDGSTTFNMPDMRGRIPLILDNLGGSPANRVTDAAADNLGGTGGAETVTLTGGQLPSHLHAVAITTDSQGAHSHTMSFTSGAGGTHTHTWSGTTSSAGGHQHVLLNSAGGGGRLQYVQDATSTFNNLGMAAGLGAPGQGVTDNQGTHSHTVSGNTGSVADHTHLISGTTASAAAHSHTVSGNTASTGSGEAHPNMPPYMAVGMIIRVLP